MNSLLRWLNKEGYNTAVYTAMLVYWPAFRMAILHLENIHMHIRICTGIRISYMILDASQARNSYKWDAIAKLVTRQNSKRKIIEMIIKRKPENLKRKARGARNLKGSSSKTQQPKSDVTNCWSGIYYKRKTRKNEFLQLNNNFPTISNACTRLDSKNGSYQERNVTSPRGHRSGKPYKPTKNGTKYRKNTEIAYTKDRELT